MADSIETPITERTEQLSPESVNQEEIVNIGDRETVSMSHTPELDASSDVLSAASPSWLDQTVELISDGGPVVMILLFMSVVAMSIVLYKSWQFFLLKLNARKILNEMMQAYKQGDLKRAINIASGSPNPVTQAMRKVMLARHRKLPESLIREEVQRYGSDALYQLREGFRPLEVIASLAPLLGLLGTVMGMITAFQQLEAAGSKVNPAILSGGIWEALLTTAVGLAVAIPVVVLLNWLERRVDKVAHDMENYVTQIFTLDVSESLENGVEDIQTKVNSNSGVALAYKKVSENDAAALA